MTHFYGQTWDRPHLTPSIARVLYEMTPLHARRKCPYYTPERELGTSAMTEGSVVDALVFGTEPDVTVLDFDSFRTQEAKKTKAELEKMRQPFLLRKDYERCVEAADRLTKEAVKADPMIEVALARGILRQRHFWRDEEIGVDCSTEPDIELPEYDAILDLKRTVAAPTVSGWRRHVSRMNYQLQVGATLEATGRLRFAWLVIEAREPHCAVVHWASDEFLEVARRDWREAKETWARCVEDDDFPGYQSGIIDPMPWQLEPEDQLVFDDDDNGEESEQ